jgi:hypothetical protein
MKRSYWACNDGVKLFQRRWIWFANVCVKLMTQIYCTSQTSSLEVEKSISQMILSIYLRLYSPVLDPGLFFSFLILYTVGRTPWTGDQPVASPSPTHRTTQTQNKRSQTSMPLVGFLLTLREEDPWANSHSLFATLSSSCNTFHYSVLPYIPRGSSSHAVHRNTGVDSHH